MQQTNGDVEFGCHVDAVKTLNFNLIYDANADDYIRFLCGQG
jgi:hypothetical protein